MIDSGEFGETYDGDGASTLEDRGGGTFYGTATCAATSDCMPLSECTFMQYQTAKSCLTSGDRSISCGSSSVEPYVCCPRNKYEKAAQTCGKSLVSGQVFKGLGSFPFVARIGFKSKLMKLNHKII